MILNEKKRTKTFTVYGKPFGKQRPRVLKNGITYTPKETTSYENYIRHCYIEKFGAIEPTENPVSITIRAYFEIPSSVSTKKKIEMANGVTKPTKKPDIDNVLKIVLDGLNGIAFKDDKQVVCAIIQKFYTDRTPRLEIEIEEG